MKKSNPYSYDTKSRITDNGFRNIVFNFIKNQLPKKSDLIKIQDNSNGLICYLEIYKKETIFETHFNKGEYIIKQELFKQEKINNLQKLSNLDLIPKILLFKVFNIQNIPSTIMIMEFFEGIDLNKLIKEKNWQSDNNFDVLLRIKIWNAISKEYEKWKQHRVFHNDLQTANILVSNNDGNIKVKFIDPLLYEHYNDWDMLEGLRYILTKT